MSASTPRIQPPASSAFAQDVLDGLAHRQRRIPCRWLFDQRGSQLFERIAQQPEYYLTRTETALLEQVAGQIAEAAGPGAALIELGRGSACQASILLGALQDAAAHVALDVGGAFRAEALRHLAAPGGRRIVFFPGSTIGNLEPETAERLLMRVAQAVGPDALMVIGVDHTRDPAKLVRAHDDAAGATAAFNRNLLVRIHRELRAEVDPEGFRHLARFDTEHRRVEMHLVCTRPQRVTVHGRSFDFSIGESIHTANAYKPSPFQFLALAHRAGWRQEQLWLDGAAGYAVHVLKSVA